MELYQSKGSDYFSITRVDLISVLPKGSDRLLEVGAGGGDTLVEIKRRGLARHVTGFELMKLAGSNQDNPAIDKFVHGDLDRIDNELEAASFDVIICGDVLEHLLDPWRVLARLTTLLRPGGTMVVSCPNVRHFKVFAAIFLKGSFRYTDHGLFDRTHLRFFCKKDLLSMVRGAGLQPEGIVPTLRFFRWSKPGIVNMLTFGLFEQFLTVQYIITAKLKT